MKKFTRTLALTLALAMMLSLTAFAAPTVEAAEGKDVEATVATGDFAGQKLDELTYTDASIAKDGQYMIFVVTPEGDSYVPTASSILYINQKQAEDNGTITFDNVFPKAMKSSGIMISGTNFDLPTLIAKILATLLGDVNEDDEIGSADAQHIQRFIVGLGSAIEEENDLWLSIADVNKDGEIGSADAQHIQRFIVGLGSALDE